MARCRSGGYLVMFVLVVLAMASVNQKPGDHVVDNRLSKPIGHRNTEKHAV